MLFKIISHQIDINADDFLCSNPNLHHTGGHDKRFLTPMTRIDCYKFSFFPLCNQYLEFLTPTCD